MNSTYSKELIDAKLDNILHRINEVKEIAVATHNQTLKTNGRVNKLEGWRSWLAGVIAVLGVSAGLIVYIYTQDKNQFSQSLSNVELMVKSHVFNLK